MSAAHPEQVDQPVPALRSGVTVEVAPDGAARLEDPVLGLRVKLDRVGGELAAALDGRRTVAELADAVGAAPESVARVVAVLRGRDLLDTAEARTHAADAAALADVAVADPADARLLVREDAAFTCTMCGSCCGGHNVGPVLEDTVAGLQPHRASLEAATGSSKGLFTTLPGGGEGGGQVVCHARGGSCVFLADDRRCIIHRDLGGEMKPRVCRLFPFTLVATPRGIAVSLSDECRGFVEARGGKPLGGQMDHLRHLVAIAPRLERTPSRVKTDERGGALAWDDYEAVEARLHAAIDAHAADPSAALVAMRGELRDAAGRAEPEGPAMSPAALGRDLQLLLGALVEAFDGLAAHFRRDDDGGLVRTESLEIVTAALRGARADMRRIAAPLDRPDQHALIAALWHQKLFGKELALAPTLVDGFARLAFQWFTAKALMIHRARQVKRRHLVAQDVMDAMATTGVLLHRTDASQILGQAAEPLRDLFFDRLPALLEAGGRLVEPDARPELVKF